MKRICNFVDSLDSYNDVETSIFKAVDDIMKSDENLYLMVIIDTVIDKERYEQDDAYANLIDPNEFGYSKRTYYILGEPHKFKEKTKTESLSLTKVIEVEALRDPYDTILNIKNNILKYTTPMIELKALSNNLYELINDLDIKRYCFINLINEEEMFEFINKSTSKLNTQIYNFLKKDIYN